MIKETRHIDLHLPRSWNQCTTEELEKIASVVARQNLSASRYHPFDMLSSKVEIVFLINRLEVVDPGDGIYTVRFIPEKKKWWQRRKKEEPFALSVGIVHAMVTEYLSWLDDKDAAPLLKVPYPTVRIKGKTLEGPTPMLDGYSWQEYRHLQDWMQVYTSASNQLIRLIRRRRETHAIAEVLSEVNHAKAEILSILFHHHEESDKKLDKFFASFDDIQWQVMLFWWSGLMKYLQQRYPRCFYQPKKPTKKTRSANPLELYTRTTATMQKQLKLSEKEVNQQSFHVILQHMEDMAKEAEEMKRISRKNGSKK